jgi:hypothetical protein
MISLWLCRLVSMRFEVLTAVNIKVVVLLRVTCTSVEGLFCTSVA